MEIRTLLPPSNALDCDQHFSALDFMATFNVIFQRNQAIQLFAISMAQWCLAQHTLIATLLHHDVAAVVALWENGRHKCSIKEGERARISV